MLIPSGELETASSKSEATRRKEAWTGLLKEIATPLETALGVESIFSIFDVGVQAPPPGGFVYRVMLYRHHTAPDIPPELEVLAVRWLVKRRLAATTQASPTRKPVAGNNRGRTGYTGAARKLANHG